jgi:hypothetical protein
MTDVGHACDRTQQPEQASVHLTIDVAPRHGAILGQSANGGFVEN